MIGNKIGNKGMKVSEHSPQTIEETVESEAGLPKERYISPEEIQKTIDDLRFI